MTLIELIVAAKKRGTPLVGVSTADQAGLEKALCDAMPDVAHVSWDAVRGMRGLNPIGKEAARKLIEDPEQLQAASTNPQTMLDLAPKLPAKAILFVWNAHRFIKDPFVSTGLCVLRDLFKRDMRTVVLLGPSFQLPSELVQDVVLLDEPLPDDEALAKVVAMVHKSVKLDLPDEKATGLFVNALRGMSRFAAEQVAFMSLAKDGDAVRLDLDTMWERKRLTVNQTKGLTLSFGGEQFQDIGGLQAAIRFGQRLFGGQRPPRAVLRIDEVEKVMAGALGAGDSSGVSQDAMAMILTWMQDGGHDGMIALGPAGAGKSMFSKALGNVGRVPTIALDLGAMKGSFVGESEGYIRDALRVIDGLTRGRCFVVATCNKMDYLPTELLRRFRKGLWFFDLPSKEEREQIWQLNLDRFFPQGCDYARPEDKGWTGAEIYNCVEHSWDLGISLAEAARYVVPVSRSDGKGLVRLRNFAEGRLLSASAPEGREDMTYRMEESEPLPEGRHVEVEEVNGPRVVGVAAIIEDPGKTAAPEKKKGN